MSEEHDESVNGQDSTSDATDDPSAEALKRLSRLPTGRDVLRDLGLPDDPTIVDIERTFTNYAKRFHPDRFASSGNQQLTDLAAELFVMTKKAADILREQAEKDVRRKNVHNRARLAKDRSAATETPDPDSRPDSSRAATVSSAADREQSPGDGGSDESRRSRINPKLESAQGKAAINKKRYAEAVGHYSKAVLAAPESAEYLASLGWARFLANRDDHIAAAGLLENAANKAPNYEWPWIYLGRMSKILGNKHRANEYFQEVLAIDPKNPEARSEVRLWEKRRDSSTHIKISDSAGGSETGKRTGGERTLGEKIRGALGRVFRKKK